MPFETTPRTGFFSSVIFEPGMYVPSGAKTEIKPGRAFGAPQTTSISGSPLATSTWTTCNLSAFGCFLASTMRAMGADLAAIHAADAGAPGQVQDDLGRLDGGRLADAAVRAAAAVTAEFEAFARAG